MLARGEYGQSTARVKDRGAAIPLSSALRSRQSRRPPGRLGARAAEWPRSRMAAGRSGFAVCRARAGR